MQFDTKGLERIIDLVKDSDLSELELEQDGVRVYLKRGFGGVAIPAPMCVPAPQVTLPVAELAANKPKIEANIAYIKSPMVGTFYVAPTPDSAPFAKIGARVTLDSTVCIIEAMKVMNEILAEINGTVIEMMVTNGQAVEFGQPLFKVQLD